MYSDIKLCTPIKVKRRYISLNILQYYAKSIKVCHATAFLLTQYPKIPTHITKPLFRDKIKTIEKHNVSRCYRYATFWTIKLSMWKYFYNVCSVWILKRKDFLFMLFITSALSFVHHLFQNYNMLSLLNFSVSAY